MSEDITMALASAEKIDLLGDNRIRVRYQDGRDLVFSDVRIYWPSFVREAYRRGHMTKQQAKKELRKYGLRLKPSADEPTKPPDDDDYA